MSIRKTRQLIDEVPDVDMTPIMSLFVILIPFLLLAAVFVKINIINSPFPKFSGKPNTKPEHFLLNLYIKNKGFEIETTATKSRKKRKFKITNTKGGYKYKELHEQMVKIKKIFPDKYRLNIYPDSDIPYDIIVQAMDATRRLQADDPSIYFKNKNGKKQKQEYLFPDVVWMGVLS